MKSLLNSLIAIAVLLIFISSCKKSASNAPESIIGKWNIQKDSTYTGVGLGNHQVTYNGQTGDHFNFSSNGHIYSMENSILDTLSYSINSDSVMIPYFVGDAVGKGLIAYPSIHTLIISSGYFLTPGGVFGRTVYLYR